MTRARDFASVISGNFAIPAGSLGNAVPADGSITTAKLADDAITSAKLADDAVTSAAIATNAVASDALNITSADLPSGTVLQCKTTNYPDDFLFSLNASGVPADNGKMEVVTGLNCSITPTSTNSKILYQATVYMGCNHAYDIGFHVIKNATSTTSTSPTSQLNYNDTSPCGGSYLTDASGNAIRGQTSGSTPRGTGVWNDYNTTYAPLYQIYTSSMSLLDHPNTTSQVTYNFAVSFYLWQSYGISLNRSWGNQQSNKYDTNPVSTVTLLEIA